MSVEPKSGPTSRTERGPASGPVVRALVVLGAAVPAVAISYGFWRLHGAAARVAVGSPLGAYERSATSILTIAGTVGVAVVVQAVATVVFLAWLHRARTRSEALSSAKHRYGRGWVVGAWFVPLANLVLPRMIVGDVLRASCPGTPAVVPVNAWWIMTVLARVVHAAGWVTLVVTFVGTASPAGLLTAVVVHVVGTLCSVVAGLLLGRIVVDVSDAQHRLAARAPELVRDERVDAGVDPSRPSRTPARPAPDGLLSWFRHGFSNMRHSAAPLLLLAVVAAATDSVDLLNQMPSVDSTEGAIWFGSSGFGMTAARGILAGDWATQLWALIAEAVRATTYSAALVVVVRLASTDVTSVLVGLRVAVRRLLPLLGWILVLVAMVGIGLLLLVVPGLYILLVGASTLIAVVTLEGRGIRRCFELVRGRFWPTALRVVLMMLISQAWWLVAYGFSFQLVGGTTVAVLLFTVLGAPGYAFVASFFAVTYVELKHHDDRRAESAQDLDGPSPSTRVTASSSSSGGVEARSAEPQGEPEKPRVEYPQESPDIAVALVDDELDDLGERPHRSLPTLVLIAGGVGLVVLTAIITLVAVGVVRLVGGEPPQGDLSEVGRPPTGGSGSVAPSAADLVASMLARSREDGAGSYHVSSPALEDFDDSPDTKSTGWFAYDGDSVSVESAGIYIGYPTQTVLLGDRSWVKVPDPSELPSGKTWIECPPMGSGDTGRDLPYRYCTMTRWALEYADPAGLLSRAGDSVTLVSSIPDALGATPATRHQLRIDWAEAATRQTDPEWREWFEARAEMEGVETINLWVDSQYRPLQRTAGQDLELSEAVGAVTYDDWGRTPTISPPSGNEVA